MTEQRIPNFDTDGDNAHPAYHEDQFGQGEHEEDLCAVYEDFDGMFEDPKRGTPEFDDACDHAGVTDVISALTRAKVHSTDAEDWRLRGKADTDLDAYVESLPDLIAVFADTSGGNNPRLHAVCAHKMAANKLDVPFWESLAGFIKWTRSATGFSQRVY
jgi:hypothetical protein